MGRHERHGASKTHTVGIVRLKPSQSSDPHFHKEREESYYFLSGTGIAEVGEKTVEVQKGDLIHAMPGEKHQFKSSSSDPLEYLIITAPSWVPEDSWK